MCKESKLERAGASQYFVMSLTACRDFQFEWGELSSRPRRRLFLKQAL